MPRTRSILAALCLPTLLLTGCGKAASTPTVSPTPSERHIAIVLAGGAATPDAENIQVSPGTKVDLDIRSDRADEVHVHGYDLQVPVQPGDTLTRSFVADRSGRFEIETHHPPKTLVVLDVR